MKHPNQAERLLALRAATGLTQKKAAQAMGINHTSLSGYERGGTRPWQKNRALIAAYYKTKSATLFGRTTQSDGTKMRSGATVSAAPAPQRAPLTLRQRLGFWIAGGR